MSQKPPLKHIFLLMLENHSFDNIFGFSGIKGTSGGKSNVSINGLSGNEYNTYKSVNYPVQKGAPLNMPTDPGHEFNDTLEQLCGANQKLDSHHNYPTINNSGFASNYATSTTEGSAPATDKIGMIMKCFDTANELPVIYALATEFAICDNWFSSLPGPTWPNRFFSLAATSGGLDDSPSKLEMIDWMFGDGIQFEHGNIFNLLKKNKIPYGLYNDYNNAYAQNPSSMGGQLPMASALYGVSKLDFKDFSTNFANDLSNNYKNLFTLIEPNYGNIVSGSYSGGSSQHPMDSTYGGEGLIKATYEAIRNSPIWENSLLIITYDEHGGFYDHVAPPAGVVPGDKFVKGVNQHGFKFNQLGVRVPAVIVSPLIPQNTVDKSQYDHSSILKTVEKAINADPLTDRDKNAHAVLGLLSLDKARTDCPTSLPSPVSKAPTSQAKMSEADLKKKKAPVYGNSYGSMLVALKTDFELSDRSDKTKKEMLKKFNSIKTAHEANEYIQSVLAKEEVYRKAKGL